MPISVSVAASCTKANLRGGGGSNPPTQKFSDFLKNEGKGAERKKGKLMGGGGVEIFSNGVEIFSGWFEKFSVGVKKFQGG